MNASSAELEVMQRAAIRRFEPAGPAKIAAMRAAGYDPAHDAGGPVPPSSYGLAGAQRYRRVA
jgi:hypothetical protein